METNEVQPLNAEAPRLSKPAGSVNAPKDVQLRKAEFPIEVTPEGIAMEESDEHP